jgi:hypothetical protein
MRKSRIVLALVAALGVFVPSRQANAVLTNFQCGTAPPACDPVNGVTECCQRPFNPGTIVIPLDRCHQANANGSALSPPTSGSPRWCRDPSPGSDDGIFQAYGLVYRLMQRGIRVYWVINPTKTAPRLTYAETLAGQTYTEKDVDMWITGQGCAGPTLLGASTPSTNLLCAPPVLRLDGNTLTGINSSYTRGTIPFRGGVFVVDASDRAAFDSFWLAHVNSGDKYDFNAVDLFEIQPGARVDSQNYTSVGPSYSIYGGGGTATIGTTLDYAPPRIARVGQANVSNIWLGKAKLSDPAAAGCQSGAWSPVDAVYCNVTDAQIATGSLLNGFGFAWFDDWNGNVNCADATTTAEFTAVDTFLTGIPNVRTAGSAMFMGAAVEIAERCATSFRVSNTGVTGLGPAPDESIIIRYPTDFLSQWGDWPTQFSSGSGLAKWSRYDAPGTTGYNPLRTTLRRLLTSDGPGNPACAFHTSTAACDIATNAPNADVDDFALYYRKGDNVDNGFVFYMGGNNVNGQNYTSHLRAILNALLVAPEGITPQAPPVPSEVARTGPVTTTIAGAATMLQGTYGVYNPPVAAPVFTAGNVSQFFFPWNYGNLRAIDPSTLGTSTTAFSSATIYWNANTYLESLSTDSRVIFTNTATGPLPTTVSFTSANAATLRPRLDPSGLVVSTDGIAQSLIGRVRRGWVIGGQQRARLGGVDRSTVVVVDNSRVIGTSRPTVVYFGGLDGMLHAVCAQVLGPCATQGQELWAFIPRVQLPRLRFNTGRIDGSASAFDVFDDFNGDGLREWKTVLTFQTGSGLTGDPNEPPAAYAIDVTVPDAPVVLWERVLPGLGLHTAMGPVQSGGQKNNTVWLTTNSGSTAGLRIMAVNTVTGTGPNVGCSTVGGDVYWDYCATYSLFTASTAVPGGVSAIDLSGFNTITDVVATSLDGKLLRFDAATGSASTIAEFTSGLHPFGISPTLYRDPGGEVHVIGISGGYVDNLSFTTIAGVTTNTQCIVSFPIESASATITAGGGTCTAAGSDFALGFNPVTQGLAYAQATVAGGELYVNFDVTDANLQTYGLVADTGRLQRIQIDTPSLGGSAVTSGGAGSVDAAGGVVYVGGATGVEKDDFSGSFDSAGLQTELLGNFRTARRLWLKIF